MATTITHAVYSDSSITLALFRDVENAIELRQCVMNGDFEAALLKTSMIVDPFQVTVAANKAVHLNRCGKMMTKNVHTEILFSLSPSKSITDSFKKFGLGDADRNVFVVVINDRDGSKLKTITDKVDGTQVDVKEVSELTDSNLIRKVYKLSDTELAVCSPLDAITTRIAVKEMAVV